MTKQQNIIKLLYNIIVFNTLKSIKNDNHDKSDNSIRNIKDKSSDEITTENMINLKENSILDFKTLCNLRQGRLESVLEERYQYHTSIDSGQRFFYT